MRKKLFFALLVFVFLFTSCGTRSNNAEQQTAIYCETATFDEGVVINGIRWATRNVNAPGTFAKNPEDAGMLFQWNRRKGWNVVDEEVEGWDNSFATGRRWSRQNDPCPEGWRMPTRAELQSLKNAGISDFTQLNGVYGRYFGTTMLNSIFLPASGLRLDRTGALRDVGTWGDYWSNTRNGTNRAMTLSVGRSSSGMSIVNRSLGFSVRCVSTN